MCLVVIALLGGSESETGGPGEKPIVPADLDVAVERARCQLRRHTDARPSEPASDGTAGIAPRPGVYADALERPAVVAALRRGLVVIQFRPELSRERMEEIESLQRTVPAGTVVTPNPRMGFEAAATAWRRALLCPRLNPGTLDAIRLFRGRYLGSKPPD